MADNTSTQTLELTQDQVVEIQQEFTLLAIGLGVPLPENFQYTPEAGEQMRSALQVALGTAEEALAAGLANGSIVQPPVPLLPITPEDVLVSSLAQNAQGVEPTLITEAGIKQAIQGTSENIKMLNALSSAQGQPQAGAQQQAQATTQMVPAQEIPADVQARVMRVEQALQQIVESVPDANLPAPGKADGVMDAQSYASYQAAINYFKNETGLAADFPADAYSPELGGKMEPLIKAGIGIEIGKLQATGLFTDNTQEIANLEAAHGMVSEMFADLDYLHSKQALAVVEMKQITVPGQQAQPEVMVADADLNVGTNVSMNGQAQPVVGAAAASAGTAAASQSTASGDSIEVQTAIAVVEKALFELGSQIGNFDKMGLSEGIVDTLSESEIGGEFGEKSQALTAQAVMLLKTMNGEQNPDGAYNATIGRQLQLAILVKPEFEMIRTQLEIDSAYSVEQARALMQPFKPEKTIDQFQPLGADATDEAKTQREAQYTTYVQAELAAYESDRKPIDNLSKLFRGLDVLNENQKLDAEKARETTKMNLMLDGASRALDKFAPGFKEFLQDFFTNSEFGEMIGGLLSMFGINVGRLWGDNDDAAATQRARPVVEQGFQKYYDAAANELGPNATFTQVMGKTREEMTSDLEGSWAFDKAMDILFKDQEEGVVKDALNAALDNAEKAGSPEAAKAAFAQTLIEAGQKFQDGQDLDLQQLNIYLDQAVEGVQNVVEERPEMGPPSSVTDADLTLGVNASMAGQATALDASGQAYERDTTRAAVDAELIEAGEQRVELVFTPNTESWIQGQTRYAHGRVDDIQEVLGNNNAALGLSLAPEMMMVDGKYTDMMTPNTNAMIEETLIRAQLDHISGLGVDITQEVLDGLDRTLTLTNLEVVTDYMRDQGLSDADIQRFSANVTELGNDFFSTDPSDKLAGDKQEHTVLKQSHFGNQFELDLAQWAPDAKAAPLENVPEDVDPLYQKYLDYNKDNPCDIPMFFVEDGKAFAAIVDKNGTNDNAADDQFKVIELNNYLNTQPHNLYSQEDQRDLLDNYNWSNPTKQGLEAVINKVLCLESFALVIDAPKAAQPSAQHGNLEHTPFTLDEPSQDGKRPEVYKDLPKFRNPEWADFIAKGIGITDNNGLVREAQRNQTHVLDTFFETQVTAPRGGRSNFMILDLDDFGLEHPEFDAIVAMRDGLDTDYRYVNYDKHDIVPMSDQRQRGVSDITDKSFNPRADRRLDDFLDEIDHDRQGPNKGYLHSESLVPGSSGPRAVSSFSAVYQMPADSAMNNRPLYSHYIDAYMERSYKRSTYENSLDQAKTLRDAAKYGGGMSDAAKGALDRRADQLAANAERYEPKSATGTRSQEFNNQSGCDEYVNSTQAFKHSEKYQGIRNIPIIGMFIKSKGDIVTGAIDTFTGKGNSYTPEEMRAAEECRMHNLQSSATDIYQNMSDMGLDSDLNSVHGDAMNDPVYGSSSTMRTGMVS